MGGGEEEEEGKKESTGGRMMLNTGPVFQECFGFILSLDQFGSAGTSTCFHKLLITKSVCYSYTLILYTSLHVCIFEKSRFLLT